MAEILLHPCIMRGFSIIELIIVCSLISMLALPCFAVFKAISEKSETSSAARRLYSDLCRLKDISRQKSAVTMLEAGKNDYSLYYFHPANNLAKKLGRQSLKAGLVLSGISRVRFASDGYPVPGFFGTLAVSKNSSAPKKVVISSVGRIRIE